MYSTLPFAFFGCQLDVLNDRVEWIGGMLAIRATADALDRASRTSRRQCLSGSSEDSISIFVTRACATPARHNATTSAPAMVVADAAANRTFYPSRWKM